MRKYALPIVAIVISCLFCQTSFAGHTVLSGVDLYPFGAQRSGNVYYYKGAVFVGVDGAYSPVPVVHSVSVSDPYNLYRISSSGQGSKAYGLKAVDNKLYVAYWTYAYLRVFDISDTGVISPIRWQVADPSFPAAWHIDVSNQRAYVVASESGHINGVRLIDVSVDDPPNPLDQIISTITAVDRNMGSIVVRGSYAYYTDGDYFVIANISDENSPYVMTQLNLGQLLSGVVVRDELAYVYCHDGEPHSFYVYDISNPVSPSLVGDYSVVGGGFGVMYLLGDYAFLAASVLHTVDISNPASPSAVCNTQVPLSSDEYGPASGAWECSVAGNGHYVYIGVSENYPNVPPRPDNYTRGKLFSADAVDVLGHDPDDIGPEQWSDSSLGEAFRYTRYECDEMPTAADPVWQVLEGSEVWASVSNGILRINDAGTSTGDKIKWWRNWDATKSYGATVVVRAKCDSHNFGGSPISYMNNIFVEDGRHEEQFAILSDRIRANQANIEYPVDGTQWHTYRITTQGSTFNVYLDDGPVAVLTGSLSATTNRARIMLGSGSSAGTQDIYFDYVHCYPNGTYSPPAVIDDLTPTVAVKAADTAGKGSLSGIDPLTAQVHWSTDGGETWSESGGHTWDCEYEASDLPTDALPRWSIFEGLDATGISTSIVSGYLHVVDSSTAWGSKIKWMRSWGAKPAVGTTILARVRCTAAGGDTTYLGNISLEDGVFQEHFKIMTDRIVANESGQTYFLDGTQWHIYRITTKNNQFKVYVDENAAAVMTGTLTTAASYTGTVSANRLMFGSGASQGTQTIDFDYLYHTSIGDFEPGESYGGGPVTVTCSGQYGDYDGVVTAYGIPFDQESVTQNKVRFSMRDMVGNTGWSPVYNVPIVDNTTSISDAKSEPDGTVVSLADKVLYFKRAGFAYIEEPDRTSGIRLEGTISVNQDRLVSVVGSMQTTALGERYIAVSSLQDGGPGEVTPLGTNNEDLRDAMLEGRYVTAWGTVMEDSIWEGFFYITDGADPDGIEVTTEGMPTVNEGDFVVVTGAAGLEDFGRGVHAREIQVVGP